MLALITLRKIASISFACAIIRGTAHAAEPTDVTRELAKTVPLADLHMHVYGVKGSTPSNILRFMKENNVQWGGGVGHYQTEMQSELGPRYIAAIGSRAWATMNKEKFRGVIKQACIRKKT